MSTKKKTTGLDAFSAKATTQNTTTPERKGEVIKMCSVRLPREAWLKVSVLALDEGTTFQALAVAGLDSELKKRGLPGLFE